MAHWSRYDVIAIDDVGYVRVTAAPMPINVT
jgi:hypothetical protein